MSLYKAVVIRTYSVFEQHRLPLCCSKCSIHCSVLAVVSAGRRFPDYFKFGAATSAYQVEGAWNVSDKGESIWDHFTHTRPDAIANHSNGDVACDSYHLWREDIQLLKNINADFYRFSISWPRVLPTGYPNYISEDGVRYYSDLIDGLLEKGIEPVVTIYHWDLPQRLQDLGGWTNPLVSEWFEDYARVLFRHFGDRVKTWITINEPVAMCDAAYTGDMAPGVNDSLIGAYMCSKHVLLAHARAYRLYEREFKSKYHGEMSLANQIVWLQPYTPADTNLTELTLDMTVGRYTHPVYSKEGGWPPALERYMAEKSRKEGFPRSRLPAFTQEEKELVRGTYDFFALNHYTTMTARGRKPGEGRGLARAAGADDLDVYLGPRPGWPKTSSEWFHVYPPGIRDTLVYLQQQYGPIRFLITESGMATGSDSLDDQSRVNYYRDYMAQVLLAMTEDDVNVFGYTAWSLMDNLEWSDGYKSRFGLHRVDFSSPLRTRTARRAAHYYAHVARAHDIDAAYHFLDEITSLHNILIFIINNNN